MQHRVLQKGDLLDKAGRLIEKGYATALVRQYNPETISLYPLPFLNKMRIKEWDYYGITTQDYFVSATLSLDMQDCCLFIILTLKQRIT